MSPKPSTSAPSLPAISIRRLRSGPDGPLVAVTVPGVGAQAVSKLFRIVAEAVLRLKETRPHTKLAQIFFDFEMGSATSAELVLVGGDTSDEIAAAGISVVEGAARAESMVMTPGHPTGVQTHSVRVIQ